ncbi:MAG: hypothetical protein QOH56_2236, partial [Pseudonocardiales bacterium]|nr:hypothetical protein [Pseudonocardiales bacterium]
MRFTSPRGRSAVILAKIWGAISLNWVAQAVDSADTFSWPSTRLTGWQRA